MPGGMAARSLTVAMAVQGSLLFDSSPKPVGGDGPTGVRRYTGSFGVPEATRLLWRAGFGPKRQSAVERTPAQLAALGLDGAVDALFTPAARTLEGPEPYTEFGPLEDPANFPYDHLWWFDRMVRSTMQLEERMALLWHDWFGVSNDQVGQYTLMADHIDLFRTKGLGSFRDLLQAVTVDGAMLVRLDGDDNQKGIANENYARELMELYTLGPDRGAYTETDVREAARGLTGYRSDYVASRGGYVDFEYVPSRHDDGEKVVFGKRDDYLPAEVVDATLAHPQHASFFVLKLWSSFVAVPPSAGQCLALETLYVESGYDIATVLRAILTHEDLYTGPPLVKQPVVFGAGLLRAVGRGVETIGWPVMSEQAGQRLFLPPNIAGWREDRWLDTSTIQARWTLARYVLNHHELGPDDDYPAAETPAQAVDAALAHWNGAVVHDDTRAVLESTARAIATIASGYSAGQRNALRQDILRHLVATCPDQQVC